MARFSALSLIVLIATTAVAAAQTASPVVYPWPSTYPTTTTPQYPQPYPSTAVASTAAADWRTYQGQGSDNFTFTANQPLPPIESPPPPPGYTPPDYSIPTPPTAPSIPAPPLVPPAPPIQSVPPIPTPSPVFTPPAQDVPSIPSPPSVPVRPPDTPSFSPPAAANLQAPTEPLPPLAAPPPDLAPPPDPPLKLWSGSLEVGISGSEGNSPAGDFRCGFNTKRKTPQNTLSVDFTYHRATKDSVETVHKAFLDDRFERLLGETRWSWFIHNTDDYDRFQAYDMRVSEDSGFGYALIKSPKTTFTARLGGGFSREIGGPDDAYVPEMVFGGELEHKVDKRQKFNVSAEYTPDVVDWYDYRLKGKASWELLLSAEMNLSLKLSASDRYDSTPNGVLPNDVDYSMSLLWGF